MADPRKLDLKKSLYQLVSEYPELIGIMQDLGFQGAGNRVMLNTVGKKMTIPQGCQMQKKDFAEVVKVLEKQGFFVVNKP